MATAAPSAKGGSIQRHATTITEAKSTATRQNLMRVAGSEGCACVVRPGRRTDGMVAFRTLAAFTDFSGVGGQYPVLTSSSSMYFHKDKQTTSTTTGPTDTSSSAWFVTRPRKSTTTTITATAFIAPRIKRLVINSIFRTLRRRYTSSARQFNGSNDCFIRAYRKATSLT